MMTPKLEEAFSKVSQLSDPDQEAFAQWILVELEAEARWDKSFAESWDVLDRLAEQALHEYALDADD
jgi:hypothetical protein